MERRHPHALGDRSDQTFEAFAHFSGRLVGEGDGEDLARPCSELREDPRDAPGEHACLAGSCAASACCGLRSPTSSSALLAMRSGSCCTLLPLTVDDDSAFLFTTWFGQCHSIWATSHSANAFLRPEAYRSSPCPACGWMPSGPSQSVCAAIALFQSTRIESVGCLRT